MAIEPKRGCGYRKRGITPVIVPDDDPDHQGSVYDKDEDVADNKELPLEASP